jgi:hypothetical protein
MISGSSSYVVGFRYTIVSRACNANTYASGPSNPFGTASIDGEQMSEYATYTTGGTVAAPVNTTLPAISGTPQQGHTLTASTGTWQNNPTSYAYQWLSCASGCQPIGGAVANTYVPTGSEVGKTLKVTVTATNGGGSTPATSNPTAIVQTRYGHP